MPRLPCADVALGIFHAPHRGNLRAKIYQNDADYLAFETILRKGLRRYKVELCANRSQPFGDEAWTEFIARQLNLESTKRPRSRLRKSLINDNNNTKET
jgi:hypothetical protein